MSESEIAQIKETIAKEYMAAKWGLTAFAQGITKHEFISARMKRIEEGCKALEAYVGNKALELVVETLETVPEVPTRDYILAILRLAFGNEADIEYRINDLKRHWDSSYLLKELFGVEAAQKIINALPRLEGTVS